MRLLGRQLIKAGVMPWSIFARRSGGVSFLIYHKVGAELPLDIDLPTALFGRQLEFLAQSGRVISYERALARLQQAQPLQESYFVLTFDDGYGDFYSHVFPLLREFELPAILFVTTGFVEGGPAYPLSRPGFQLQAVTWEMLGRMQESGLVTLGAHTHTHPWLVEESPERVVEELCYPLQLFEQRLGSRPLHFAYPGAFWDEATERLVRQYYRSAVIGGGRKAQAEDFQPYRIPRTPVRRSDGWFFFQAKLRGWLEAEEDCYVRLHRALGRLRVGQANSKPFSVSVPARRPDHSEVEQGER